MTAASTFGDGTLALTRTESDDSSDTGMVLLTTSSRNSLRGSNRGSGGEGTSSAAVLQPRPPTHPRPSVRHPVTNGASPTPLLDAAAAAISQPSSHRRTGSLAKLPLALKVPTGPPTATTPTPAPVPEHVVGFSTNGNAPMRGQHEPVVSGYETDPGHPPVVARVLNPLLEPLRADADVRPMKIILVGEAEVGKSTLWFCIRNGCKRLPTRGHVPTIGTDNFEMDLAIEDDKDPRVQRVLRLGVWDTAGQERFDSIVSAYIRAAHVAVMVFDLTNASTLDALEKRWRPKVAAHSNQGTKMIYVGNKSDREAERALTRHYINEKICAMEGTNQLDKNTYFEISAILGYNVTGLAVAIREIGVSYVNIARSMPAYRPASGDITTLDPAWPPRGSAGTTKRPANGKAMVSSRDGKAVVLDESSAPRKQASSGCEC